MRVDETRTMDTPDMCRRLDMEQGKVVYTIGAR